MGPGQKIVVIAKARKISLKQLAATVGVPYSTLRSYTRLKNPRLPSAPIGVALAEALDVPTDWLFNEARQDWPPPARIDGITWEEVQAAVAAYVYQRYIDRYYDASGGRAFLSRGTEKLLSIRPDEFKHMADCPAAIRDQVDALRKAVADLERRSHHEKPQKP